MGWEHLSTSATSEIANQAQADSAWRAIFSDKRKQLLLSSGALMTIGNIVDALAHYGAITIDERSRAQTSLKAIEFQDLGEATKPFFWRFDGELPDGERRKLGIGQHLHQCATRIAKQQDDSHSAMYLRNLTNRYYEAEKHFGLLRNARNVAAHDLREHSEVGWCLSILASVIRVLEICDYPKDTADAVDELRSYCIRAARNIVSDRTSDGEVLVSQSATGDPTTSAALAHPETRAKFVDEITETITDRLYEKFGQPASAQIRKSPHSSSDEGGEFEPEELDFANDSISPETLRQKLQSLKAEIDTSFTHELDWPGPEAHILQRAIIHDVMLHKPRSLEDWKRTPDTAWRYVKHKVLMDRQLAKFGSKVNELLASTAWAPDEIDKISKEGK